LLKEEKCNFNVGACSWYESSVSSYDSQLRRSTGTRPKEFWVTVLDARRFFMGNS